MYFGNRGRGVDIRRVVWYSATVPWSGNRFPRYAGLVPKQEEAREYLFQNIDRYLRASDFLTPQGKRLIRHLKNHQIPPQFWAWLVKYRGFPREMVPYPIAWDSKWGGKTFMAIAEWASLRRMAEYLSMKASGIEAVNREEVIRWLYGKEPADEYKPLIEEMAHPKGLTAPEGAANQEVGLNGGATHAQKGGGTHAKKGGGTHAQ